jgi:hypothetical protein
MVEMCEEISPFVPFSRETWDDQMQRKGKFLISNFRRTLNVVFFPLGDSPASEFYVPTFRNTLFHLQMSCEQETWEHKIHTQGNHPKERIQKGKLSLSTPYRRMVE